MADSKRGGLVDPPVLEWAGRWVSEQDVLMACGDPRDWFTYEMRLQAYQEAWARYYHARRRKRNPSSKFNFAQVMIIGDMGASKSTMAAWECHKYWQRGHAVFHNGPFLFGRVVEGSAIYEIVDQVPRNSIVVIDEAHSTLDSGMVMSSGIRAFNSLCAGLRKKNCRLILISAMASMIGRRVRDMCSEVWRPCKPNIEAADFGYSVEYPGHSNPRNFVFAWEVWRDFPFRGEDLTSSRHRRRGFGPSDDTRVATGEAVRNAFLLTNSFDPVEPGVAQQYATKEAMNKYRNQAQQGLTEEHRNLVAYLWGRCTEAAPPAHINAAAVAFQLGMNPAAVGRMMSGLFGDVDGIKTSKGYDLPTIKDAISDRFSISVG